MKNIQKFLNGGSSTGGSNIPNTGNQAIGAFASSVNNYIGNSIGGAVGNYITRTGLNSLTSQGLNSAFSSGFNNTFSFKPGGGGFGLAGMAAGFADKLLGDKTEYSGDKGAITQTMDSIYDTLGDAAAYIPGWGQFVSLGMKGAGLVNKALNKWTGSGTDGMTTADAILGSNLIGGSLNPISAINGWTGKRADKVTENTFMDEDKLSYEWGSYSGALSTQNEATNKSGKKYGGLFSNGARRDANKLIARANMNREYLLDFNNQRELGNIRAGMSDANRLQYQTSLNGGFRPMALGREGMKVVPAKLYKLTQEDKQRIKDVVACVNNKKKKKFDVHDVLTMPTEFEKMPSDTMLKAKEGAKIDAPWDPTSAKWEPVEKFQKGGDLNVIPEGNLHARLHHMEDADNLTKKGIPVVDNNGQQQAEIEKNEIIFRKEVTDKIEELAKDGSDDAAIKCGKLLATEIMENTDDRTGLIDETLNGKHEVFPEKFKNGGVIKGENGMPTTLPAEGMKWEFNNQTNQWEQVVDNATVTAKMQPTVDAIQQQTLEQLSNKELSKNIQKAKLFGVAAESLGNIGEAINKGKKQAELKKQQQENDFQNTLQASIEKLNNETVDTNNRYIAQEGMKLPEFKTFFDLKNYLNETGRDSDEDYDLEAAYNDPEVYGYWREEEEKNPGKGHWLDKYKKDSHITYSVESVLGDNPKQNGGLWANVDGKDLFIVSPYLENKHSLWDYLNYFTNNEPEASFRYNGITYSTGRKKK